GNKLGAADIGKRLMQRARYLDVLPFRGDDGIDQASDLLVKRRAAQLPAMVLDGGAQPIEIALDHGRDQRLPVGEILIETADRDAGALSDPPRRLGGPGGARSAR